MLVLTVGVYLFTATGTAILDDGDAIHTHVAQGMSETGDWVTPHANGVRYFDKPPISLWLPAIFYQVWGVGEFATRLPTALAVLGVSLLLFLVGKRAGGDAAGFIAASAFAFSIGTFLFTRMNIPDIFLLFFLTLALVAFLRWYWDKTNPVGPALLFYAALAGGMLSKGFIGMGFPVIIAGLFLLWQGQLRRLRHFHVAKGATLFFVLASPWYILAGMRNQGFLWYNLVNEQIMRFLGTRDHVDYESIFLPFFWVLVLAWIFPWTAFLPALRYLRRGARDQSVQSESPTLQESHLEAQDIIRLCLCWIVTILVFFSFSVRTEHYSMPIFPPLALLFGLALSPKGEYAARTRKTVARGFAFLGVLGVTVALLAIIGWLWLWLGASDTVTGTTTARLHAYGYYFAPLFEMPPEILARLKAPFLGTCVAMAVGFPAAWFLNRRSRRMAAILALNLTLAAFCVCTWVSLGVCEVFISSRQFGQKLASLYQPGDTAVILGDYETANSINFYTPTHLCVYKGSAALLSWGMSYPDAPPVLLDDASFAAMWHGARRTFLLAPEDQVAALELPFAWPVLRSGGRVLLYNRAVEPASAKSGQGFLQVP
jgi:4-amino-4-deoxy-L-arabinose transferase-like glycosyltransferase